MALKCPDFYGIPLVSHAGSTTYFPARVVRQLGGLQVVPEDMTRDRFEHIWWEDQTSVDRWQAIEQVMAAWQVVVTEQPYFPEHPTQEERDFQATEEYVLRSYRWCLSTSGDLPTSPRQHSPVPIPNRAFVARRVHGQVSFEASADR
ncbi:hypothetical protein CRG98_016525 [Punica granatum]|uniref:Uncharacterized protein n=1 Tax=Punica granatum TaxID=22663 RepID=A0A2I0K3E7_PUNGR|nr:hypothetical protein CRG98_016525 [Punica granatum]